ncbi:unnamed protein product [Owenia fusiformis]|uniref:Uncharacterized protein n=1 Tax=Owenia fusiformis TaxID=6347 RepID=A0A8J1XE52_OWEFU|nr:unnamed protein product [Owenia fusiformis]
MRLKQKDVPSGLVYEQNIILIHRTSLPHLEHGLLAKMLRVRSVTLADEMRENYYYEHIGMTSHNETFSLEPTEVPFIKYPEQIPTFPQPIFSASNGGAVSRKDFYLIAGLVAGVLCISLFLWCSKYRGRKAVFQPVLPKCISNRSRSGINFHVIIIGLLIIGLLQFSTPFLYLNYPFPKSEPPRKTGAIPKDIRNGNVFQKGAPLQKGQENLPNKDSSVKQAFNHK